MARPRVFLGLQAARKRHRSVVGRARAVLLRLQATRQREILVVNGQPPPRVILRLQAPRQREIAVRVVRECRVVVVVRTVDDDDVRARAFRFGRLAGGGALASSIESAEC